MRQTPFEIAEAWYNPDSVWEDIKGRVENRQMPRETYTREFAEWLTSQYRLAMAKGIQLARGEDCVLGD